MKKVLSLVLAIAMVLSMTTVAFADTFADVTDKNQAKAVDTLTALGVVTGYDDGSFKPGKTVSRAEMAALLVRALGHADLAAGSSSSFSDAKGQWYDGEVAIAQSLGLVNGYPDGTFKGEKTVAFTEAITMIMRALGYNNRAVNTNRDEAYNATAYKTAAARLGILKNVEVAIKNADRGSVAVMLYNALEVPVVIVNKDGQPVPQVVEDGKTHRMLLDDIATRIPAHPVTEKDLFGKHVADLTEYLGETVLAYANKDGKIVYVRESAERKANKVVTGLVSTADANNLTLTVKVDGKEDKYDVTSAAFYVNGESKTTETAKTALGKVTQLETTAKVVKSEGTKAAVVVLEQLELRKADAKYIAGKTRFQGIDLPTDKNGKVDFSKIVVVGDAKSLDEIAVNDVLQVAKSASGLKIYVTRNTVVGQVTEVADKKYYINGTAYEANGYDGLKSLELGAKGTFFLDKAGKLAFSAAEVVVSDYGIITATNAGVIGQSFGEYSITKLPQIKMVGVDGVERVYDVKVTAEFNGDASKITASALNGFEFDLSDKKAVKFSLTTGAAVGNDKLVKFTKNAEGQIVGLENVALSGSLQGTKKDAGFLATSNTVVLAKDDKGAYSLVDLAKLTDAKLTYNVVNNGQTFSWDLVIITNGIDSASTVKTYAVLKSTSQALNADGTKVTKVKALVDGKEVVYTVSANLVAKDLETLLEVTFDSKGVLTATKAATTLGSASTTAKVQGNVILLGTDYHAIASDVVVYRYENSKLGVGDIYDVNVKADTDNVTLYDKNGDKAADVIVIGASK